MRDLVPWPRMEPGLLALGARSLNHWTIFWLYYFSGLVEYNWQTINSIYLKCVVWWVLIFLIFFFFCRAVAKTISTNLETISTIKIINTINYCVIVWMKNITCHISKQRMLQPSNHHITASWTVSPRELRIETGCPPSSTLRKLRMRKHRMLAPDTWGAYQRNDFSEPRLFHLPIYRKVLNSLTWDIWFSLINRNLLMFLLPGLCCKNSCISWLSPLASSEQPLRVIWDVVSRA